MTTDSQGLEESPGTKEQGARENERAVRFENSATENIPPMARKSTGKVEIVR